MGDAYLNRADIVRTKPDLLKNSIKLNLER